MQLRLPFKESKQEKCQRILAGIPKLKTAAQMFDEQAYREATILAAGGGRVLDLGGSVTVAGIAHIFPHISNVYFP